MPRYRLPRSARPIEAVHSWTGVSCVVALYRQKYCLTYFQDNIGIGKLRHHTEHPSRSRDPPTAQHLSPAPPGLASSTAKSAPDSNFLFGSLPSSFTTLLLSVVDSPAYANLTSSYLNDIFNPATPNDPTVKYFSVAGRMDNVSIWHPFWLSKAVLDSHEDKHRTRLRAEWESLGSLRSNETPLWTQDREWGNDGLVTVQSAKWGEFLGIMEGCDRE